MAKRKLKKRKYKWDYDAREKQRIYREDRKRRERDSWEKNPGQMRLEFGEGERYGFEVSS